MAFVPLSNVIPQLFDDNGNLLSGGKIKFYDAGTTTPTTVYSDSAGTALGTEVDLDADGHPRTAGGAKTLIWLETGQNYKIEAVDASGVNVWGPFDNIPPFATSTTTGNAPDEWAKQTSVIYNSATSFIVPGDPEDEFGNKIWHVGRRVAVSGSSTGKVFGTISAVSIGIDTTITLAAITDSTGATATLSNESLTAWVGVESVGPSSALPFGVLGAVSIEFFREHGGTDNDMLVNAAAWSKSHGRKVYAPSGTYSFSTELDFTATGAGLIGDGPQSTILKYSGTGKAIKVDQGGTHGDFTVSGQAGTFIWGEVVTGGTSGAKGIVRSLPDETLQIQTSDGTFQAAETITGGTSGATATIDSIGAQSFGDSLFSIKFEGFTLEADFVQSVDGASNPTDWMEATGIYLNGARNNSHVTDVFISEGFKFGLYVRYGWMSQYDNVVITNSLYGVTFDTECNNIHVGLIAARRAGAINNISAAPDSGHGVLFTGSYGVNAGPIDVERVNCPGVIWEKCRGFNHLSGDIENTDQTVWKVFLRGLPGADYANDRDAWTRAGNLLGVRFRNTLGIIAYDGTRQITIGGCDWSEGSGTPTGSWSIRAASGATHIEDICILDTNNFFGDNATYAPTLPFSMQSTSLLEKEKSKYHVIESLDLDVTDANFYPVGYLPVNGYVVKIQIFQVATNPTGSCNLDINTGDASNNLITNFVYDNDPQIAVWTSPYGITEVTGFDTGLQSAGIIRARLDANTMASGTLRVRIWWRPVP